MEPSNGANARNRGLLSNLYNASKQWKEVAITGKFVKEGSVQKERGIVLNFMGSNRIQVTLDSYYRVALKFMRRGYEVLSRRMMMIKRLTGICSK